MVVKSKIGRKRYIVFKIDSETEVTKRDLIYSLNSLVNKSKSVPEEKALTNNNSNDDSDRDLSVEIALKDSRYFKKIPWIIFLEKNYGLVQCHHLDKNRTIGLLHSIRWAGKLKNNVNITTLGTTGTILSARKKYLDKLNIYPLNNMKTK
jgi:RNase P/RNase MRP subunit POP5